MTNLMVAHQTGDKHAGIDIEVFQSVTFDSRFKLFQSAEIAAVNAKEKEIFDTYLGKFWGLKFATTAACTVLKVDQVHGRCRVCFSKVFPSR